MDFVLLIAIAGLVVGVAAIVLMLVLYYLPKYYEARLRKSGDVLDIQTVREQPPILPTIPEGPGLLWFDIRNRIGVSVTFHVTLGDLVNGETPLSDFPPPYRPYSEQFNEPDISIYHAKVDPREIRIAPHDRAELTIRCFPKRGRFSPGKAKVSVSVVFIAEGFHSKPYTRGPFEFAIDRGPLAS